MDILAYLERIGVGGQVPPDRDSLDALMRAHVRTIPFENLDVQLGRRLTTAPEDAFEKIVGRGRGGWCYEQNGLFGWALGELGFEVVRMAGAVRDDLTNDAALNNHLVLAVRCPEDASAWLVDVGFGGSHFGALPLAPHTAEHEPYELRVERLPDERWRFSEKHFDAQSRYDFAAEPADETALAGKCSALQTDPDSTFVLNLVAQRRTPTTHVILRGRVLSEKSRSGVTRRRLDSADELVQVLLDVFGLDVPAAASLWPRILARHEALGLD